MERAEAIEKGYLANKIVYLRPIVKEGDMIKDLKHIAIFKMEGAGDGYTLKMDPVTQRVINPFKNDEEMKYFSDVKGEDLNPYKKGNEFWRNYTLKIVKTPELMSMGRRFDMSDPDDALAVKVLLTWPEVGPDWESRRNGNYRYVFVDENYEYEKAASQNDELIQIGEILGEMKNSPTKMRNFLNIYYQTKHKVNVVPEDATPEFLAVEIRKIVDKDRSGFLELKKDPYYNDKVLIAKAIDKGQVERRGVGTYIIVGVPTDYKYDELYKWFHEEAKAPKDDIYLKIKAACK